MANFNAPFEVNPYDLPTASANGGNLTSEDHDESLPQAFPSYGSSSLPVSSTVGRTEEAIKKVRETKSLKGRGVDSLENEVDDEMRLDAASYGLFFPKGTAASPSPAPSSISASDIAATVTSSKVKSSNTSWDLEEDAYFMKILNETKRGKGGALQWETIEEHMRDYWREQRGPTFSRTKTALKARTERYKNLEEIGINPLNYVARPWTVGEEMKLLSIDADQQHKNKSVGIDYSKAVHLFVGRPRFDLKEKRSQLMAEAKKKAKQEEEKKKREAEIEQYKASALAASSRQIHNRPNLPYKPFDPESALLWEHPANSQHIDHNVVSRPSNVSLNPTPLPPIPHDPNHSFKVAPAKRRSSLSRLAQTSSHLLSFDCNARPNFNLENRSKRQRDEEDEEEDEDPLSIQIKRAAPKAKKQKKESNEVVAGGGSVEGGFRLSRSGISEVSEKKEKEVDVYGEGIELIRKMRGAWDELDQEWDRLKGGKGGEKEMGG